MNAELRNFAAQLSYMPKILHLIWKAARWWTVTWAVLLTVLGVLPAVTIFLTRLFVDSLTAMVGVSVDWQSVRSTVFLVVLMGGLILLSQVLQSILDWVRTVQAELVRDYLASLIHEKATALDLAFYESPIYHDRLFRARQDVHSRPLALLENGGGLLQSCITLVTMAALLIPYGLWLPLLLFAGTLPALYVVLHHNRRHHRWWEKTTADRRRVQYYDTLLVVDTVAAEMRLFDLGPHFRAAYQKLRHRLRTERIGLTKRQGLAQLAAGAMATLTTGVAMAWMIWQALLGLVTLGDLVLFYQAFNRGQSLLRALLGNLGQIYSNTLFLGNLFEFLELEPQVGDPPQPIPAPKALQEVIHFRRVTFRYHGSERAVFQDFDFVIPAGKIIAIVGANGAGKTTLVKLLCRFYDVEEGSVELDGIDIRNMSVDELRGMITVLFQFPVPYHTTAAENIAVGALGEEPSASEIEAAARSAGAHDFIMRLPQGYDTLLGKWFSSGTELSGGEWQRLALARAYLRRAQIIILDEPTSFMDSWAETDWFDRLQELADGQTAIVITHRFTIAKRADVIHVMDEGQIVESGSHDELLAADGLYAQSWIAQMQARTKQPKPDTSPPVLEMPEALIATDTPDLSRTDGSFGRP